MQLKHSKFKNTGILFELLVRRITADTLSGNHVTSPAVGILKKYFVNTELGKEYKLYDTIIKSNSLTESKANIFISSILETSKRLNRKNLKRDKYNLIKEIKENYSVENFFQTKIINYSVLASIYTLVEIYNTNKAMDPNQLVDNKLNLLEHLTKSKIDVNKVKETVLQEFQNYDKDLRILAYRVLLEKFNTKYKNLNSNQKEILKEFINSVDSTPKLKEYYNNKVSEAKITIKKKLTKIKDKSTQIKLFEVSKLIKEVPKKGKVKNDHLVDLLQYYELVGELEKVS